MSVKVSVIIPVYNAENYLDECIQSLLSQTLQECEFILVNDGSTDQSRLIIERYQNKDVRIVLINQHNQGVSIARNKGVQMAVGEYIGFVDADDYIEEDMYETLYSSAKQGDCDVVISNLENEMGGHKMTIKYSFPVNKVLDKEYIQLHILPYFLKSDNLNTAGNKIYKSKLIQKHCVEFPEKVALGEDGMFNMQFMSHAATVKYIDYIGYHYREVVGSATRNISQQDYFGRALEVFNTKLPATYISQIDEGKVRYLKSIKLINNVISYTHIYFTPSKVKGFPQRYRYVKNMIGNPHVREALSTYSCVGQGRYEKWIVDLIKRKSTFGLYFITAYSRFRNK